MCMRAAVHARAHTRGLPRPVSPIVRAWLATALNASSPSICSVGSRAQPTASCYQIRFSKTFKLPPHVLPRIAHCGDGRKQDGSDLPEQKTKKKRFGRSTRTSSQMSQNGHTWPKSGTLPSTSILTIGIVRPRNGSQMGRITHSKIFGKNEIRRPPAQILKSPPKGVILCTFWRQKM